MPKHPLDDCDPDDCYRTMMSERTELIKARREAEDNLVKSVIQLSSGLLILLAGFITQSSMILKERLQTAFILAVIFLFISIMAGLAENFFSSKAYLEQQKSLEDFYTKKIDIFSEPAANGYVRNAQFIAFTSFLLALFFIAIMSIKQVGT